MVALDQEGFSMDEVDVENGRHVVRIFFEWSIRDRDISRHIKVDVMSRALDSIDAAHREAVLFTFEALREAHNVYVADFSYLILHEKRKVFDSVNVKLGCLKGLFDRIVSKGHDISDLVRSIWSILMKIEDGNTTKCIGSIDRFIEAIMFYLESAKCTVEKICRSEPIHPELMAILMKHGNLMRYEAAIAYYAMYETFKDVMIRATGVAPDILVHDRNGKLCAVVSAVYEGNTVSMESGEMNTLAEAKVDEVMYKVLKHMKARGGFKIYDVYSVALEGLESIINRFATKASLILKVSRDIKEDIGASWVELKADLQEIIGMEKCFCSMGLLGDGLKKAYANIEMEKENMGMAVESLESFMC